MRSPRAANAPEGIVTKLARRTSRPVSSPAYWPAGLSQTATGPECIPILSQEELGFKIRAVCPRAASCCPSTSMPPPLFHLRRPRRAHRAARGRRLLRSAFREAPRRPVGCFLRQSAHPLPVNRGLFHRQSGTAKRFFGFSSGLIGGKSGSQPSH